MDQQKYYTKQSSILFPLNYFVIENYKNVKAFQQ